MHRLLRIAPVLVLAVTLAACSAPKDSAETVGPASTDGSETTETAGSPTTEGADTTEGTADGELGVDGATSVDGTVAGTTPTSHEVIVPDGVQALVTVTPGGDYDIVAETDGETADDGLSGDPETIRISGPTTFTLRVYGYYDDAAGPYTVTVEAA